MKLRIFGTMKNSEIPGELVKLVENEDYYLENGLMVLTAHYLWRRGYCCKQGCRHCPYGEEPQETKHVNFDNNEEVK